MICSLNKCVHKVRSIDQTNDRPKTRPCSFLNGGGGGGVINIKMCRKSNWLCLHTINEFDNRERKNLAYIYIYVGPYKMEYQIWKWHKIWSIRIKCNCFDWLNRFCFLFNVVAFFSGMQSRSVLKLFVWQRRYIQHHIVEWV